MTNKPMLSVEQESIALEALKAARQFIANGIELGFISMPEPETPDPAHDTLPMIDRAIAELKSDQHQGGVTLEQVLKAYDYANSHPHKYLRGTTNWCAAVAHALNVQHPAPAAVVLPDRLKTEPFTTIDRGSKNYKSGYNAAISEVAKLNGLKP